MWAEGSQGADRVTKTVDRATAQQLYPHTCTVPPAALLSATRQNGIVSFSLTLSWSRMSHICAFWLPLLDCNPVLKSTAVWFRVQSCFFFFTQIFVACFILILSMHTSADDKHPFPVSCILEVLWLWIYCFTDISQKYCGSISHNSSF